MYVCIYVYIYTYIYIYIYISSAMENGKYMNYQYNSEQIFIICSNKD